MIYYIILVLLILLFIGGIIFGALRLNKQQDIFDKEFENIDDMKNCPKTARYFTKVQSTFNTWSFSLIACGIMGIVVLALMTFINLLSSTKIPNEYVIIITLFITLGTFTAVYKVENCILARMCGKESCAKPIL